MKKIKGFTLIEIIISIVIFAVLIVGMVSCARKYDEYVCETPEGATIIRAMSYTTQYVCGMGAESCFEKEKCEKVNKDRR